jgi:5-methylcytosine-specific restriction endonuclease McrA
LDKKIVQAVLERSKGVCENCGAADYRVQLHHIIKGLGKRKQHETIESVILLCWNCHHGTYGVHGREGKELDIKLKRKLQETYFNQGYSVEEVRRMMGGKIYE